MYKRIFFLFLIFVLNISRKGVNSKINIKEINENSLLTFSLTNSFESPLYIKDKEYSLPIDINSDRTIINNNKEKNNNKNLIYSECYKDSENTEIIKNKPISFFDSSLILDQIAYEQISNKKKSEKKNNNCNSKGVIGLSRKSENKILNFLTQLNGYYSIKKYFSIYKNELFIGNLDLNDNFLNSNKKNILSVNLLDLGYKWVINLGGIFIGEINNKYTFDDKDFYAKIINNKVNNEDNFYQRLNIPLTLSSTQNLIFVNKSIINFLKEKLFSNKCSLEKHPNEDFEGFYCKNNDISNLPPINFIINDNILSFSTNKLFIKMSDCEEYLFGIVNSEEFETNSVGAVFGTIFYNDCDYKIVFDAENNKLHFVGNSQIIKANIIEKNENKIVIINNESFSKYDLVLCFMIILNFLGIISLIGVLIKDKIIKKSPKEVRKFKPMSI